jgi:hypothetical protein|tara:strand:- start:814 stop:1164 length:351 start_codon:yes stop_codon:yes gene_type:complete
MQYDKDWWEEFRRAKVEEILELTGKKNADYTGARSEPNPFQNFDLSSDFDVDPIVGVCVRMQDKFQRAKAFCKQGNLELNDKGDTVEDIFKDLIGYSLIVIGMLERQKNTQKNIQK